jgi:hypothetical protein
MADGWKEWSAQPSAPKHDPLIEASCIRICGARTQEQIIEALVYLMMAACVAHKIANGGRNES